MKSHTVSSMNKHTPITDLMSDTPVVLHTTDPMQKAQEIFREHGFHHLPVVDDKGHLAGMVSFNDYMRVIRNIYNSPLERKDDQRYLSTVLAKDIMTPAHNVVALDTRATLEDALRLFLANRFHALPIIESSHRLAGIITVHDLVKALSEGVL